MDLTKFLLTWFIANGLWMFSSAFWSLFLSGRYLQMMEGLSAAAIGFTLGVLFGYIDFMPKLPKPATEPAE